MVISATASPAFSTSLDELTTSSVAHPDTWNPTHQKLLNNDVYLKKQMDENSKEIQDARGGKVSLNHRISELTTSVSGQSEEADNNKNAVLLYALQRAALAGQSIQLLKEVAQQQGELLITNRGVISGCTASKSITATRNLNFTEGVCFAQGRRFSVKGTDNSASVPSNPGASAVTVIAYLFQEASGTWRPAVTASSAAIPDGAIPLYQLTIPAGNTDATDPNLANVMLTSIRRIEPQFPLLLDSPPTQSVAIKVLNASDYHIAFDVVSAQGAPCSVRSIVAISRATNGFSVELHSAADNVRLRWHLSRLSN